MVADNDSDDLFQLDVPLSPADLLPEQFRQVSLRGAELRSLLNNDYLNGGSFDRKLIIPSGLIPRR
jgi:hypothetical protein